MNAKLVCGCLDNAIVLILGLGRIKCVVLFKGWSLRVADRLCLRVPELSMEHQTLSGTQLTPSEFTKCTQELYIKTCRFAFYTEGVYCSNMILMCTL